MSAPVPAPTTDPTEEIELAVLLDSLALRWGIDLHGWAAAPLRARLTAKMAARGLRSISEAQGWLLRDRAAVESLIGEVWSRPPRGMFADPPFWRGLRRQVIPLLRSWPVIRVWVAGCGGGEDAWSMAVLLDEEGLAARSRVQATDADEALLEAAASGTVPAARLASWALDHRQSGGEDLIARFEVHGEHAKLDPSLLGQIAWARHLPGVDAAFNEFSLILFRNPFVWTGIAARRRVTALLRDSQARFGFLCLDDAATLHALEAAQPTAPYGERWDLFDRSLGIARRVT